MLVPFLPARIKAANWQTSLVKEQAVDLQSIAISLISALVGAVIGAWLSNYWQNKNEKKRKKEVHNALLSELRDNLNFLPKKSDLLTKLRIDFAINRYLPVIPIPFSKAIYVSYLPMLYNDLKPEQVRQLHLIYFYLSTIDDALNKLDAIVAESKAQHNTMQPCVGAQQRIDDLQRVSDLAKDLLSHYLDGTKQQLPHNGATIA
jgi:hypothetical protein